MDTLLKVIVLGLLMTGFMSSAEENEKVLRTSEIRLVVPEHGRDFLPSFELTLFSDGKVIYNGKKYVKVEGRRTSTISLQKFKRLIDDFDKLGFFDLKVEGKPIIVGGRAITILVRMGKKQRTISHFHNEVFSEELHKIENKIHQIAVSKGWIR